MAQDDRGHQSPGTALCNRSSARIAIRTMIGYGMGRRGIRAHLQAEEPDIDTLTHRTIAWAFTRQSVAWPSRGPPRGPGFSRYRGAREVCIFPPSRFGWSVARAQIRNIAESQNRVGEVRKTKSPRLP